MIANTNTAAIMLAMPRKRSRDTAVAAMFPKGSGCRLTALSLMRLRALAQVPPVDRAHIQLQPRAAASRGQRHTRTGRSDGPYAPIEVGQGGDVVIRHATDQI